MLGLPRMPQRDGIRKYTDTVFRGYDHRLGAGDGTLWDMKNMTGDYAPLLASRRPRYLYATLTKPNGFYCHDGLYWVDGTSFIEVTDLGPTVRGTVADSRKTFCSLGAYIIILPDKKYYNRLTGAFGSLESGVENLSGCKIQDGTYVGEAAEANTIYKASAGWATYFNAGDAVTISGAVTHPENNTTIIIREIDGDYLRFYENSFVISAGGDTETLTIQRTVPDMDYICENENRLWGCKGDQIYASKLGDPFNWNVFDGLATDSYQVGVGSVGDFTGCASMLGYPCFFKEEHIYKVYGDRPSNFQVMGSASLGIEEGSSRSPGIAGEVMFYLARTGIVAYSGGIPQSISAVFGTDRYKNAVGGSDGVKYYVSMQGTDGNWSIFVYDTETGLWHREDAKQVLDFGWNGNLYFLDADGNLWLNGDARDVPILPVESPVESMAEFGDFTETQSSGWRSSTTQPNKKGTAKIQIRIELEAGAEVKIDMQFDSDGVWRRVSTLQTDVKRSYYLPIIPRRSDHFRIRFTGTGAWRLYSLVREHYIGSEL